MVLSENSHLLHDAAPLDGDVLRDAKMIWIYCLALNISELQGAAERTRTKTVVALDDKMKLLVGYTATLWDPRKDEWRPLTFGFQVVAERGGQRWKNCGMQSNKQSQDLSGRGGRIEPGQACFR
jgi:hypothetical protein